MRRQDCTAAWQRCASGLILGVALAGILVGCAPAGPPKPAAPASVAGRLQHYADPFGYCRAVGTLDRPDARYTGINPPPAVIAGLIRALGAEPSGSGTQAFIRSTYWRCMDGVVYACNVGANLPCESRADTRRTPTAGENAYCATNPDSSFIPMYVTGHATIYDWHCAGTAAIAGKPIARVDARGFIAGIWYRIPAPADSQQ